MAAFIFTGEVTRSDVASREPYGYSYGGVEYYGDISLRLTDGSSVYFKTPGVSNRSAVPVFPFGMSVTVKGRVKADRVSAAGNKYKVLNYVKVLTEVPGKSEVSTSPVREPLRTFEPEMGTFESKKESPVEVKEVAPVVESDLPF